MTNFFAHTAIREALKPASPTHQRIALISVHGDPLVPLGAEEAGGQNVYVREVARALAARGHAVDVYTRGRTCTAPEVHRLGEARVIRLPAGPTGFIPRTHLFQHLPAFAKALTAFAAAEGRTYDVLHTNYWLSGWVGLKLAKTEGIPLTHTFHSLGAIKYLTGGKIPANGQRRLQVETDLLNHCDRIIATSPQEEADMRRHYMGNRPIAVIPCGVDDGRFRPGDRQLARKAFALPTDRPLIAYAGRFDPRKGIATLVQAAARLRERQPLHLVFAGGFDPAAGDAVEHTRIRLMIEERGLGAHTTWLGSVSHERLPDVYRAADLTVVPSLYEPFGLVAIEAMASGSPVVASRVGGLQHSVADGRTGLLVPPGSPEDLADACQLLLDDPAMCARMGSAASRRVAERFTWSAVAERLERHYGAMVAARRCA